MFSVRDSTALGLAADISLSTANLRGKDRSLLGSWYDTPDNGIIYLIEYGKELLSCSSNKNPMTVAYGTHSKWQGNGCQSGCSVVAVEEEGNCNN